MSTVQLLSISPEELSKMISQQVKSDISLLLNENKPKESQSDFISPDEAAALLKVNKVTLWRYVKRGTINKYSFENKVYYKRSEIEQGFTKSNV